MAECHLRRNPSYRARLANDLDHAAAPNRRSLFEIVLRLQWLHATADRRQAIDAMIEAEKKQAQRHLGHLAEMGLQDLPNFAELEAVITDVSEPKIRQQARSITDLAKATPSAVGLFRGWREETQNTHATGNLAISYAPLGQKGFEHGKPFVADPELESLLRLSLGVLAFVARILLDEGAPKELTDKLFEVYFSGINDGL